jgi:UDP-N-acetylmuramoyl-tripeptide--D-alanyl-D-alanine ligase
MRLMTLREICQTLSISDNVPSVTPTGYSTDTRTLKKGELYIALRGERVDGHDCLEHAKQQGACAALVATSYQGANFGLILLRVENPLIAFQELARKALQKHPVRIAAITGSLGKTTTKEFLKTLLESKYKVSASPGNSNSQVGIPLAIMNHTDGSEEIIVLEMGMTHPKQISNLIDIAPPEMAILTTAALVHAWNFDSLEDIARAKSEIYSHPKTKHAVIHADISNFEEIKLLGSGKKVSFSTNNPQADYFVSTNDNELCVTEQGKTVSFGTLPLPGKHNIHNLLAAIAGARYFDVSWEQIRQALPKLQLPERRLQFVQRNGITFLNDAYNAAELSVKAALESLPEPEKGGRKIAVLGSMMELGKFSDDCHYRVGEHALKYVETVFCLGEETRPIYNLWKNEGRSAEIFHDRESLVQSLKKIVKPNDVILLKGSRSKELWKVVEEL